MHGPQRNTSGDEEKPDIVQFYNQTKSGVDTLDKIIRGYSSKRKYRRWPVHVFFALVDCGVYVAFQMYQQQELGTRTTHYKFRKDLAYQMCIMPFVQLRSRFPRLRMSVKNAMEHVGMQRETPPQRQPARQGRCFLCPRKKDRKVRNLCTHCNRHVCHEHLTTLCNNCNPH